MYVCLLQVSMCSGTPVPTCWVRPWRDTMAGTSATDRPWRTDSTTTCGLREGEWSTAGPMGAGTANSQNIFPAYA